MKKLLIIFFFVLITNAFSQVQYKYYPIQSGTTNNLKDIRSFYVNTTSNYLISGDNGTLLRLYNADSECNTIFINSGVNLNQILIMPGPMQTAFNYLIFGNSGNYLRSTSSYGYNWGWGYTGFSNNIYSGIYLSGSNFSNYGLKFIAVGSNGLIINRHAFPLYDTSWHQLSSGTTSDLKSINAYNDYTRGNIYSWIAGANGTILKTNDTGNTWTAQISGTTNNLNAVFVRNSDTVYAAGDGGVILMTTNGGASWNRKTSNTAQNLNSIYFSGTSDMYIAGDKVVLMSTNKGATWDVDTAAPKYNFNSVFFLYSRIYQKGVPVFVGESGKIFKKTLDSTFHPNIDVKLDGNNISAYFNRSGVFDQDFRYTNTPGFEWPKGSGKYAIFTAGFSISAFYNNTLRQAVATYCGEYVKGYCENGVYKTNTTFKYYKVNRGDNSLNNWDWANWGLMVPYGAPFIDVNKNGKYEPEIDTPGVKNAAQTIFYCMTDADSTSHNAGEGFGGGTKPLYAEVHLTAWVYDIPELKDVQFINYSVINKGNSNWKRTYMSIFSNADLGDDVDDYSGCDIGLNMTYCYNSDNYDQVYGANPPAVGFSLLSGPTVKNGAENIPLGMTSSISFFKSMSQCENDPNGEPYCAHLMFSGYKKDSTSFLDPTYTPFRKTKYTYSGDPETNTGWTKFKGFVNNCNLDSTGQFYATCPSGNNRIMLNSGSESLNIAPGDTQRFAIAQLIARGTSNLNSVTELKNLCRSVRIFYNENFPFVINPSPPPIEYPVAFLLDQNYPNPFNATTRIKFHIPKINGTVSGTVHVTLKIYDMLGRLVQTLVNGDYSAQDYEVIFDGKNFASGMYFYKMTAGDYSSVKRMVLVK